MKQILKSTKNQIKLRKNQVNQKKKIKLMILRHLSKIIRITCLVLLKKIIIIESFIKKENSNRNLKKIGIK